MRGRAAASVVGLLAASAAARSEAACATGLYMIVARGTRETKGAGITGIVTDSIVEQIPGSRVAPLDYPASLTDPDYDDSVADGVGALQGALDRYTHLCPGSKVAILGFSQGAHVSTDAICGGAGDGFHSAKPLSVDAVRDNVVAIVLFGDPTHVANTTYGKGTSVNDGVLERDKATVRVCEQYADRLVSYCDVGDVFCDAGDNSMVHSLYIARYGQDMVKFVVDRFHSPGPKGNRRGNSTATATPTAPSSTTVMGASAAPTATGRGRGGWSRGGGGVEISAAAGLVTGDGLWLGLLLTILAMFNAL